MFLIQSMLTWHGLGLNNLLSVLDKIAPFKTIRIKQRTQPWVSTEIIKLINLRDNYLRQFRKSKNQSDYELFIYHRNQVRNKEEKYKSQYYINVVNENKNRPKKLWQILKEVGSSTKCKTKESRRRRRRRRMFILTGCFWSGDLQLRPTMRPLACRSPR